MHCFAMIGTMIDILDVAYSVPVIVLVVITTLYLLLGRLRVGVSSRTSQYDTKPNLAVLGIFYSCLVFRRYME